MHKRSNMLLMVGVAAFVVGAALVVGLLRNGDSGNRSATDGKVLVATQDIAAGTSGADAMAKMALRSVPASARAEDGLTDTAALAGRVIDVDVAAGEQLRASSLRPVSLRSGAITIPKGKQGVAVQLPFVSGGAGYVSAGDVVNIYGNIPDDEGKTAMTKLVLGNVKVLDVSNEVAPRVSSSEGERPAATTVTYLLALDPNEAERVIFLAANAQLWLALQNADAAPLPATQGRTNVDVFK